jgi:hypothetical protein
VTQRKFYIQKTFQNIKYQAYLFCSLYSDLQLNNEYYKKIQCFSFANSQEFVLIEKIILRRRKLNLRYKFGNELIYISSVLNYSLGLYNGAINYIKSHEGGSIIMRSVLSDCPTTVKRSKGLLKELYNYNFGRVKILFDAVKTNFSSKGIKINCVVKKSAASYLWRAIVTSQEKKMYQYKSKFTIRCKNTIHSSKFYNGKINE